MFFRCAQLLFLLLAKKYSVIFIIVYFVSSCSAGLFDALSVVRIAGISKDLANLAEISPSSLLVICVFVIISNLSRLLSLYAASRLAYRLTLDLERSLLSILLDSYAISAQDIRAEVNAALNTSLLIVAPNVFIPSLSIVSSFVSLSFFVTSLCYLYGYTALFGFLVVIGLYVVYFFFLSKPTSADSNSITDNLRARKSVLGFSFANYKEIIASDSSSSYLSDFTQSCRKLRLAESRAIFNSFSPRYFIETAGLLFLAAIVFAGNASFLSLIEAITPLGYVLLRLLPLVQTFYGSLITLLSYWKSLLIPLSLMVRFKNLYSHFQPSKSSLSTLSSSSILSLDDFYLCDTLGNALFVPVSFSLSSESLLFIAGPSGTGKSSLLDFLCFRPQHLQASGSISSSVSSALDHRPKSFFSVSSFPNSSSSFNGSHITYMSQSSLFSSDKLSAILFSFSASRSAGDISSILRSSRLQYFFDFNLILESFAIDFLSNRQISDIEDVDPAALSGGQIQRICLLRSYITAVENQSKLLLLDEPFSAIDSRTTDSIVSYISKQHMPFQILIVSHYIPAPLHGGAPYRVITLRST